MTPPAAAGVTAASAIVPIDAQLIDATLIDPGQVVTIGDKDFVPVALPAKMDRNGKAYHPVKMFSQKEIRFLNRFMQSMSLAEACLEIGVDEMQGRKYLRRPHFKAYLDGNIRQAALASGTNVENHIAWLRGVRDGISEPGRVAMEAAKQLSRFLKPAAPVNATQININAGAASPSPFKGMSIDQLAGEMRQRIAVIEATKVQARPA
jgi:hypothetical protein